MMPDQAAGLRPLRGAAEPEADPALAAARCVAVVSGKGGVGKTNLVVNLAVSAAGRGRRVLVVDGDLGLANVDVLLGLAPRASVASVLEGRCSLEEALVAGPRGIRVLPAASARSELAALAGDGLAHLVKLLWDAAPAYDLVLVDAGAGIGPAVIGLARACRRALVVTTPEPTSFADAYAMWKVLRYQAGSVAPELIVNAVRSEGEGRLTHARLERMARRFLASEVPYRGSLPRDPRLADAVARQRAVVELFPSSAWARRVLELSECVP